MKKNPNGDTQWSILNRDHAFIAIMAKNLWNLTMKKKEKKYKSIVQESIYKFKISTWDMFRL